MDFALTLLEQLNSRYRTLTSTPNSKQYPDTTGAVARKSSIGRTPVPRPSARQPNPGTGTMSRTKRGLFDFVGTISKSLFGVATDHDVVQLKEVVNSNRNALSVITHQHNKMLTVVNATRFQMLENRETINNLIDTTSALKKWVARVNLRQQLYHVLIFRINMIENLIRQLERSQDKMLRMRKDLEHGVLSEELLPLDELGKLTTSSLIPKDSSFVTPLFWYYTHLHVKMLRMEDELVYSVGLPLVSNERSVAKQFESYPTPNVISNVTLQILVHNSNLFKSHTGQAIQLPDNCIGSHPLVCPPMPVLRDDTTDHSCASALLKLTHRKVSQECPVKVTSDVRDKMFYHDVNSFVLVTWGTDVVEGCLHSKAMSLTPGTYLISWSGECPLCTKQHCIPGIVQTGSTLRLENTWQAIQIPKMQNLSVLNITANLLRKRAPFKVDALDKLFLPEVPSIVGSKRDTGIMFDVILFISILCVSGVVFLLCFLYFKRDQKTKVKIGEELELAMPLKEPNKADANEAVSGNVLTPEQAAAILLSNSRAG